MNGKVFVVLLLALAATAVASVQCRGKDPQRNPDNAQAPSSTSPGASQADTGPGEESPALPENVLDAAHRAKARMLMDRGAAFLVNQRDEDGAWSLGRDTGTPAITAMVLKALIQHPAYGPNHPVVAKGLEVLLTYKQSDGGIYEPGGGGGGSSYTSAVALMAFAAARNPQYAGTIRELVAFLKGLQIVPGSESSDGPIKAGDPRIGGVSYGRGPGRPDLSNVGMWTEALHESGVKADDPALQRAVDFISRLQNHSETNTMAWAKNASNDGGYIYTFPGQGPAGAQDIRSYGSMTYTGFKSMLYAGVDRKDSRVRAALDWIREYWRLDGNPNMPAAQAQSGLYYYYHVFAKALRAWGEPVITDAQGVRHNWRHELIDTLAKQAQKDGSWVNNSDRWWESEPVLTTSYSLLALEEALSPAPDGQAGQ